MALTPALATGFALSLEMQGGEGGIDHGDLSPCVEKKAEGALMVDGNGNDDLVAVGNAQR